MTDQATVSLEAGGVRVSYAGRTLGAAMVVVLLAPAIAYALGARDEALLIIAYTALLMLPALTHTYFWLRVVESQAGQDAISNLVSALILAGRAIGRGVASSWSQAQEDARAAAHVKETKR